MMTATEMLKEAIDLLTGCSSGYDHDSHSDQVWQSRRSGLFFDYAHLTEVAVRDVEIERWKSKCDEYWRLWRTALEGKP
jgi:hypothetical protein